MEAAKQRKASPRARVSRRNANRRWCIPPALLHEPEELLEAVQIFDEFSGKVGLVLWQSLRDVTLWAAAPEECRDGLFTEAAGNQRLGELLSLGAEQSLEVSLTTLAALVGTPASASPEIISLVCLQVSRWAEAHGAMATAMAYAQAGALARPEDPGAALAAGALALRWRRSARAETWLRRCIGLARRTHSWTHYAQAYVDLGLLYTRRGEPRPAYRYYVQGLRAARRYGMLELRGAALHGLLRLALIRGDLADADRLGRAALRAYGRTNPRIADLLYDLAQLWMRQEDYARAIPVLQRVVPTRVDPVERAQTLAFLAHAAAGAGETRLYQESWIDAWTVINRRPADTDQHLPTLLELARASALIRDWAHVEQATRLAADHVNHHREPALVAQLEEVAAAALRPPRTGET